MKNTSVLSIVEHLFLRYHDHRNTYWGDARHLVAANSQLERDPFLRHGSLTGATFWGGLGRRVVQEHKTSKRRIGWGRGKNRTAF